MTSVSEQSQAPQGCGSWCEQDKPRQKLNLWSPNGPDPENTDPTDPANSASAQWECIHTNTVQNHFAPKKSPNPTRQNQAVLHFQCTELEEVLETPRESFGLVWRSSHGRLIKPKRSNQKAFPFAVSTSHPKAFLWSGKSLAGDFPNRQLNWNFISPGPSQKLFWDVPRTKIIRCSLRLRHGEQGDRDWKD